MQRKEERGRQKKEIKCFQLVHIAAVPRRAAQADLLDRSKHLAMQRPRARNSPSAGHRGKTQRLISIFRREIYSLSTSPAPGPLVVPIPGTAHTLQPAEHPNLGVPSLAWGSKRKRTRATSAYKPRANSRATAWRSDFSGDSVLTPSLDARQLCRWHLFPLQRGPQDCPPLCGAAPEQHNFGVQSIRRQ